MNGTIFINNLLRQIIGVRKIFVLWLMMGLTLGMHARPRTLQEMRTVAASVLLGEDGARKIRSQKDLMTLEQREGLAVMGFMDGGFAIMAVDDAFPAVLGYSETVYDPHTGNENFRWWLQAMETATRYATEKDVKMVKPDTLRFPASVNPLLTTKWDQDSPYNDLCPSQMPTGCVATAAAQVLKYHQWPLHSHGTVYTYYPFGNFDGRKLSVDLDGMDYNYEAMLDSYSPFDKSVTFAQKFEVAKLMYHIGLSMKAQYAADGTGAYSETLCHGLRNHFDYPLAVDVERKDYTTEEWMDMIFWNISRGMPIIYGGSDEKYSGHEFVLHGYNQDGLVFINWGWGGSLDGYYNLSALSVYWGLYELSYYQDMVLRVSPVYTLPEMMTVEVAQPGTLAEQIGYERIDSVTALCVRGTLNSTDFRTLRRMAGSDATGHGTMGSLSYLDLSEAHVVEGGEPYLKLDDQVYTTSNDQMPPLAFYQCSMLIDVSLPHGLKSYGDGVFAECSNLDRVSLTASDECSFVVDGPFVFNHQRDELIECLPVDGREDVEYCVPEGVTSIHDYAFSGRYLYERLSLPSTLLSAGKYAFNRCYDLSCTYLYAKEPPVIDETTVDLLDISLRTLYVPKSTASLYKKAVGWSKYRNNIKEWVVDRIDAPQAVPFLQTGRAYDLTGKPIGLPLSGHGRLPGGIIVKDGRKVLVR